MLLMLDLYCIDGNQATKSGAVPRVLHVDPEHGGPNDGLVYSSKHTYITLSFRADLPQGGFYCHNDMCNIFDVLPHDGWVCMITF